MFASLPPDAIPMFDWTWSEIGPYYRELTGRALSPGTVESFLADWTAITDRVDETYRRLNLAVAQNTVDGQAEQRFNAFLDGVYPAWEEAEQRLREKLLESGLEPAGFEIPMRKMRADAALFCPENLPLMAQEPKLSATYNRIIGAQTVEWEGQEVTISQLQPLYQNPDRALREQVWRLAAERQLADREAINDTWQQLLPLRLELARNAGFPDYRSYRWQQRHRFDYSPEDCIRFHDAIEQVVVPAASRIYEKRRQRLGLEVLRPWDLNVDPLGRPPLRPFSGAAELQERGSAMFHRVDPELGAYFDLMVREELLDLENRKNKSPGANCTTFAAAKRPFLFMNAVGLHSDVDTLLHESGHAFHVFERAHLPYTQQRQVGAEFNEVASMAMELLASPYLVEEEGGFYSEADAARARVEHLEKDLLFWPYMAVVDAFQHWVYENPDQAGSPAHCDARWMALWQRFMPGVDWSGLEQEAMTGWQRKLHIHRYPFYYVEYGLAQLGAVQVWGRAMQDQAGSVAAYRRALALGGTVPLPELYRVAGAELCFDATGLRPAADRMMETIEWLETP